MTELLQIRFACVTALALLSACTTTPRVASAPTASVAPALETAAVASTNVDAADDPAIWAAPQGGSAMLGGVRVPGFIAGTDKKAGLYFFGLDGKQLQFLPDGLLNNVDLRTHEVDGRQQVLLGASDRGRMGVALYLFDPASTEPANAVRPWGFIKSDVVEPYGFCLGRRGAELHAFLIGKDGQVRQYRIDAAAGGPTGIEVRRFAVGTQSEGCVVDDDAGALYVGEELKGLWRYGFAPDAGETRSLVQAVDSSGRLIADVEGVTLIRDGAARYLLVSSQGDSAFAVWRVDTEPTYVGRFRVAAAGGVDAVSGTDGLDGHSGLIGAFPQGLIVVQDDRNEGMSQNFKLIDWREIKRALKLQP